MRTMRTMLFILGMHRSGTSALAGSLEILGGTVPARRVPAEAYNPKGHFEPADVVEANDALLRQLRRTWASFSPVPAMEEPAAAAAVEALSGILASAYPDAVLAVVKDPRMSALFPLWADAAANLRFRIACLVPVRPPMESAQSLLRRDGLPLTHGIALWMRSILDSERHTRGLDRAFVNPDALVGTPVAELSRVGNLTGIVWPRSPEAQANTLAEFLDRSLLHEADPLDDNLLPVANDIHDALRALLSNPRDTASMARLDAARHTFDAYAPALERWIQVAEELALSADFESEGHSSLDKAGVLIQNTRQRRDDREAERRKREADMEAMAQVIESLRLDRDHNLNRATAAVAERDKAVAEFQRILADCKVAEARAEQAISTRDDALGVIESIRRDRDWNLKQSSEILAERDRLIRTLEITVLDQQQALARLKSAPPDGCAIPTQDHQERPVR